MFAVAADHHCGSRTRHQVRASFKHRIDLLVYHQTGFALRVVVSGGEFRKAKLDDFTGFERQHGAGEPREVIDRSGKDFFHRDTQSTFEFEMT